MARSTRHLILCADDFGLTEGVSRGILELARMGRISATSAMTNRPLWPRLAPALREVEGTMAIGLHLTLTLGEPTGPMPTIAPGGALPSFDRLLRGALIGRLSLHEIEQEIDRQITAFTTILGRAPDFIDGHQHVHILPGIRQRLLRVLQHQGLKGRVWLRDPSDRVTAILHRRVAALKALVVNTLAAGFGQDAQAAGFDVNSGFSGFSPFDPARDIAADFAQFLKGLGPRPLVMCHPGYVDEDLESIDPVVAPREREFTYLSSELFPDLLRRNGLTLATKPA